MQLDEPVAGYISFKQENTMLNLSKGNYVMDVTREPYLFKPIGKDGTVADISIVTPKCPGNLVGIVHDDSKKAQEWMSANPNWKTKYQ